MEGTFNNEIKTELIAIKNAIGESNEELIVQLGKANDNLISKLSESNQSLFTNINTLVDSSVKDSLSSASLQHSNTLSASISTNLDAVTNGLNSNVTVLANAIGTIPDGSYLLTIVSGIVVGVVATVVAFGLNWYSWERVSRNKKVSYYSKLSLDNLEKFEGVAVDYWLKKKTKQNTIQMQTLEIKIKSNFTVLSGVLELFSNSLGTKGLPDKEAINTFVDEMFDIATGGDFETVNKKSSKQTAHKIVKKCSSLKNTLFKHSNHM